MLFVCRDERVSILILQYKQLLNCIGARVQYTIQLVSGIGGTHRCCTTAVYLYHTCSRLELYRYSMIIDSSSIFYLLPGTEFHFAGKCPNLLAKGKYEIYIDFVGISEPKLLETGAVGRVQGYKRGRGRGIVQSYIFTRKYSSQPVPS